MNEELNMQSEAPVVPDGRAGAMPAVIQGALARLDGARAGLQRIRSLIQQAQRDRAEAQRGYEQAFSELAETEAAVVADGGSPNQALRKATEQHQKALLTHSARVSGLRTRERSGVDAVDQAMHSLTSALDSWRASEIAMAKQTVAAAMDRFLEAITTPVAVGLALGDSGLTLVAQKSSLPDIRRGDRRNAFDELRFWRQGPAAPAVAQFSAIKMTVANALASARTAVHSSQNEDPVVSSLGPTIQKNFQ